MQAGVGNEDLTGGASVFDLPKLTPRQAGERARIWVPDPDAIAMVYVHGIGGKEAQQPGMPEPSWGGSFICQGDGEVLKGTAPHSDPVNCFMCRMHKDGNPMVGKAKRKFISQVFRYATDPSANQPLVPFSMSLLVWQFSDKQYRALTEIQSQWGPIRDRDLLLTSDQQEFAFKQWAVQALPDCMLMRDPSFTAYMTQAWQAQAVAPENLERILGKVPSNEAEVLGKIAEITPGAMAAPGMAPAQYATAPMMPGAPPMGAPPMGAPPMVPAPAGLPPAPGYAPPPAAAVYPPNGPFDQAPQYAQPGMVPPPGMPPTPPPAAGVAPPLPQAPQVPQQAPPAAQAQYAQPPAPQYAPPPQAAPPMPQAPQAPLAAPQVPQQAPPAQAAPPMPQQAPPAQAAPPMPQAPPAAPQVPQQAPPVAAPGAAPQPGAPAAPGQVDYGQLLQQPPPPPPPA